MKALGERSRSRTSGALWLGAPLVLAACVAAKAAPDDCGALERQPAETRLGERVRAGVAHLACSTRPTLEQAHVAFVLFTLERLAGGAAHCAPYRPEPIHPAHPVLLDVHPFRLDPGRTSSPIAAP